MKKRVSVCLLSASIFLTPHAPASGPQSNNPHAASITPTAAHNDLGMSNDLVEVLAEGDEATAEWLREKYPNTTVFPIGLQKQPVPGVIGSTVIPAAKILTIKRCIQQRGGLKAAFYQVRAHNFSWPSIQRTGGALRDLGAETIGVAGVAEYCFSSRSRDGE